MGWGQAPGLTHKNLDDLSIFVLAAHPLQESCPDRAWNRITGNEEKSLMHVPPNV